jgi:hypothetical protein
VDLFRYVAWLVEIRHAPKPEPEGDPYENLKERARARNAALRWRDATSASCRKSSIKPEQGAARDPTSATSAKLLPADVPPAVVARPLEGHREDRAGRAARWPVRDGDATRIGQDDDL